MTPKEHIIRLVNYIYKNIYIYRHMHTNTFLCIYTYIYTYINVHIYTYMYTHRNVYNCKPFGG